MKILALTPRLPHADVISGHKIVHQRIRGLLDRGHQVAVASFAEPSDLPRFAPLRERLLDFFWLPDPSRRHDPRRGFTRLLSGVPPPFSAWASPAMARAVGDLVEKHRFDVALAEFTAMGQFAFRNTYLSAVRRVVSVHQCETVACANRIRLFGYGPAGLRERCRLARLRPYELALFRRMDRVLVLTPQERYQLQQHAPDLRLSVVPSGVDTRHFAPPAAPGQPDGLLFTGFYTDEPNRDAIKWFVTQVWPSVRATHPEIFFYIVGPHPTAAMLDMARRDPRLVVTGEVDDIRRYMARAYAFVCPVRMGSGMRGKILEALAFGLPVVTTSLGAEGFSAQNGENCLLADTPEIMARHISLLLDDPGLRRRLARQGREQVVARYSWEHSLNLLEQVLREVAARRG